MIGFLIPFNTGIKMIEFKVEDRVFEMFPEFLSGIVVCKEIDNTGVDEDIMRMLRTAEESNRKEFDLEDLGSIPYFKEWRRAYSSFGVDPTKFKSSSEALARRAIKGNLVPHINKLVDSYNFISLKYHTPCGGEDTDKLNGDIMLKYAEGYEKFTPLGTEQEVAINRGEIIYSSGEEVICSKWNWRESEKTKLRESTKNAFLIIETLPPITDQVLKDATEELVNIISRFCKGTEYHFIGFDNRSCQIC